MVQSAVAQRRRRGEKRGIMHPSSKGGGGISYREATEPP